MGSIARELQLYGGLPGQTALTLGNAFAEILNVEMDDAADVTGGGTTRAVGFQVTDFAGNPIDYAVSLELAVFDDVNLTVPATSATLATATQGTILAGSATAALKVRTDTAGRFLCTLTNLFDTTVYLGASPSFGSPLMDCREIDSVTFSA
jgi:hypothetical protein